MTRAHRVIAVLVLGVVSIGLLFSEFNWNSQQVVEPRWFTNFPWSCECLVMGRMSQSREHGIFSGGGFNGIVSTNELNLPKGSWIDRPMIGHQYRTYANHLPCNVFTPYFSQPGGQSLLYETLDPVLPQEPQTKLLTLYGLTAFLAALTLACVLVWFYLEFGWCVALGALVSLVFSQWVIVFARSLWWCLWSFYLPMTVMLFYLKRTRGAAQPHRLRCALLLFSLIVLKYLMTGFEYITTALLMTLTPFIYEGLREWVDWPTFFKKLLTPIISLTLAILFCVCALTAQIAIFKGSLHDGVQHMVTSFQRRSHADPEEFPPSYTKSLKAGTTSVLHAYFEGTFVNLTRFPWLMKKLPPRAPRRVTYTFLSLLFLGASLVALSRRKRWLERGRWPACRALVLATWFAMLAPLSWYVIFKAHSYIHLHLNSIAWQMPFTIFGFAVCGLAVRACFLRKVKKKSATDQAVLTVPR